MDDDEVFCSAVAGEAGARQPLPCPNLSTTIRKIQFKTWKVEALLCRAHAELWDLIDEVPVILKRIKDGRSERTGDG